MALHLLNEFLVKPFREPDPAAARMAFVGVSIMVIISVATAGGATLEAADFSIPALTGVYLYLHNYKKGTVAQVDDVGTTDDAIQGASTPMVDASALFEGARIVKGDPLFTKSIGEASDSTLLVVLLLARDSMSMLQPFDSIARRHATSANLRFVVATREGPSTCDELLKSHHAHEMGVTVLSTASSLIDVAHSKQPVVAFRVAECQARVSWRGHVGFLERYLDTELVESDSD